MPAVPNSTSVDDPATLAGWLEESWDPALTVGAWWQLLADAGLSDPRLPSPWGRSWTRDQTLAFHALMAERKMLAPSYGMGNFLVIPTLREHATKQLQERLIPEILNGRQGWCQLFSEPGAGSDLASLRTRAERVDDHYIVVGQKMWSSGGQYSDWCMLLVRTDHDVPQHKGITCLLAEMHVPGVEVRPIVLANGNPETTEVFWDEVQVPAENRLGEEGDGWRIAMTTVSYERGPADVGIIAHFRRNLRQVERLASERGLAGNPEVRKALARAYVLGEELRLNVLEQLSMRVTGRLPGPEASVSKQLWTEAEQYLQHVAMDLVGADALTGVAEDRLSDYFYSRPISVYGGSAQIQRNLLAQRVLGMPRG